jgi:hypothetical protein
MNPSWSALIVIVAILVVGVPTWFMLRRNGGKQRLESDVKGFGISVKTKASSDVAPGVVVEDATSREGRIIAEDQTGRGAQGKKLDAKQDIVFTNVLPGDGNPPKA